MRPARRLTVYFALGGVGLALAAGTVWRGMGAFRERAWGCDPFGYLVMARSLGEAFVERHWPDLELRSPQLALAARRLTEAGVPLPEWRDIGPHATHYFAPTERWVVQYPPGTGLLLAAFGPENEVRRLARADVIALLVLAGMGLRRARSRASLGAGGLLMLTTVVALDVLRRMGDTSFSIEAALLPLITAVIAATVAGGPARRGPGAWRLTALAGMALGAAVACRIPVVLLLPGILLLLPARAPAWGAFAAGFAVTGAVPVALYQYAMTGNAARSTYGTADLGAPSLAAVTGNLDFYLGAGGGAVYNWCFIVAFVGYVALFARHRDPRVRRVLAASLTLYAVPLAYFLSHGIAVHYYSLPSLLAALTALAAAAVSCSSTPVTLPARRQNADRARAALAALPAVAALAWLGSTDFLARRPFRYPSAGFGEGFPVPSELRDPHAWITSDVLSGSFYYYHAKAAFRLEAASPRARRVFLDFARRPGERMFFVADGEHPGADLADAKAAGWQAVRRGEVASYPYYELKRGAGSGAR